MIKNTTSKRLLVFCLVIAILVVGGCSKDSSSIASESDSESTSSTPEITGPVLDKLSLAEKIDGGIERNKDTVGWLTIPNTTIDNQVLQRNDTEATHLENNSYYIRIDEDKKPNIFGCYWLDPASEMGSRNDLSKNTIIYGHADYRDTGEGLRFSQLFKYNDIEFLKANPYIYFSTEDEDMVWQIFSAFYTDIGFNYIQANPSEAIFNDILDQASARNEYLIDTTVTSKDKILTLSTCTGLYNTANRDNYRFVVMAKLMPMGDVAAQAPPISRNPNPQKS